jgi:polyhydroxyalkanoate synthesis regulator protein
MPSKQKPDLEKQLKALERELKKLKKEIKDLASQSSSGDILEEHKKAIDELMDSGVTVMRSLKKFYQEQKDIYQILGQMKKDIEELKTGVRKSDRKEYEKGYENTDGYQ